MLFFSANADDVLESDEYNKEALACSGYYEVVLPLYNRMLYNMPLNANTLVFNKSIHKFVFNGSFTKVSNYDEAYLEHVKKEHAELFTRAFSKLEELAQRPYSALLTALILGEDFPEPDADFIWQFEAMKEENRKLLASLNAATTWEEAEAIKPWMPWEAPTFSPNLHSNAEQNL